MTDAFGPQVDDDLTVADETSLYRRVSPRFIKREGEGVRLSSGAFQNTSGTNEMSVSSETRLRHTVSRLRPGSTGSRGSGLSHLLRVSFVRRRNKSSVGPKPRTTCHMATSSARSLNLVVSAS